jgi:hypothetical protein
MHAQFDKTCVFGKNSIKMFSSAIFFSKKIIIPVWPLPSVFSNLYGPTYIKLLDEVDDEFCAEFIVIVGL